MKSIDDSTAPRKGGAFDTGIREAWAGKPQLATNASSDANRCNAPVQLLTVSSSTPPKADIAKPISAERVAHSQEFLARCRRVRERSDRPKALHQLTVHLTSEDFEFAKERAKEFRSFNAYLRHALSVERASRKPSGLRLSDEEIGRAVRVMIEEGRKP